MELTTESPEALLAEVRSLREALDEVRGVLGLRRRVVLRALREGPLLGQPVTVEAAVGGWTGEEDPSPGVPVTFAATWGKLRLEGYEAQEGNTLTVPTGADGRARVVLLPPTGEELTALQQGTLESALSAIRPGVETPEEVRSDLQEMARQYQWELNAPLREAVDVYFAEFHRAATDRVNFRDDLAAWPRVHSAVLAFAGDPGQTQEPVPSSVSGTAVLPLVFHDWLAPWLQAFHDLILEEGVFRGELADAARYRTDPEDLVADVYDRVQRYQAEVPGKAGAYVARLVTEASLRDFVYEGLGDLPSETRISVFPALESATRTLLRSDVGVLSGIAQTRRDLGSAVTAGIGLLRDQELGPLVQRVSGVETTVQTKVGAEALTGFRTEMSGLVDLRVASAAAGVQTRVESGILATLDTRLAGKADTGVLSALDSRLSTALGAKVDAATFSTFQKGLGTTLAAKVDATALQQALSVKADATAVGTLSQTVGTLQTRVGTVEGTVLTKVDAGTFGAFRTQLDTTLAAKADTGVLGALDSRLTTALGAKVDATAFQQGLAAKVDATTFQAGLAAKLDTASFGTFQKGLGTTLAGKVDTGTFQQALAVKADATMVGTLSQTVGTLQTRIGTVEGSLLTKVDTSTFSTFQRQIDTTLLTKVDTSTFSTYQTQLSGTLATKVDSGTFRSYQTQLSGTLATKVDAATYTTQISSLEGNVSKLQTSVTAARLNTLTVDPTVIKRPLG